MKLLFTFIFIFCMMVLSPSRLNADWWQRPCTQKRMEERTVPIERADGAADIHFDGECPTEAPAAEPTSTPAPQPTQKPAEGASSSSNDDDPCAPGKSFVGDYCGWSPRVGGADGSGDGGQGGSSGGDVLGLSNTSGNSSWMSDILLLSGIVCLLLYIRSKLSSPKLLPPKPAPKYRRIRL